MRQPAINVDRFVPADAVDPVYHSGRTYYLLPEGPIWQRPYALMRQTMAESGLNAIARVVFTNREHLVVVRPVGEKLLGLTVLEHAAHVKRFGKDEAKLAWELLAGMTDAEPDLSQYHNRYVEKLKSLIATRVEGEELIAPPAEPSPPVTI